jgi:hypothetical protein
MVHDVFIGHAHKDKSVADAICERLESAGVRCWIAGRDISAGEDWTEATRNAIGSSRVMVILLSENANSAPHIQREIAHAFYTKRIIIPLRLTNTLPSRDFLFYLGNVRWFDAFSTPAEEHLEALTASIKELVPGRTVPPNSMSPPTEGIWSPFQGKKPALYFLISIAKQSLSVHPHIRRIWSTLKSCSTLNC